MKTEKVKVVKIKTSADLPNQLVLRDGLLLTKTGNTPKFNQIGEKDIEVVVLARQFAIKLIDDSLAWNSLNLSA